MKYFYSFKRAGDLTDDDECCIDNPNDDADTLSAVVALNSGTVPESNFWFGTKASYPFVPAGFAAIVREKRKKQEKSDALQRTAYCRSKNGAYGSRARINHRWNGTNTCTRRGRTKAEVKIK